MGNAADHAFLAPSDASRWVNCPGSALLQAQFPEPEGDSVYAEEGTQAHGVAAEQLALSLAPALIPSGPEMAQAVGMYVTAVRAAHNNGKLHIEEQISVRSVHPDRCWGTCDLWWYDSAADILHVWDFKYGWGLVEARYNWQLLVYAAGICETVQAGQIMLHIVQPRPYHPDGPHRTWTITLADLMVLVAERLAPAAELATGENPPLQTGPHCRYCDALYYCPAAAQAVGHAVDVACTCASPTLPPEQIGFELSVLRRASEIITHRLAATEQTALSMIKGGTVIPGWTSGFTPGRKKWTDEAQVRAMAGMYGLDLNKPPELITPPQAINLGLPADVVKMYVTQEAGKAKLEPVNMDQIKQLLA